MPRHFFDSAINGPNGLKAQQEKQKGAKDGKDKGKKKNEKKGEGMEEQNGGSSETELVDLATEKPWKRKERLSVLGPSKQTELDDLVDQVP